MASLSSHSSSQIVKLLFIGDSGSGKTGALASLVKAGYNLRIADYDNGVDILYNVLTPEERKQVDVVTLTDKLRHVGNGRMAGNNPTAWTKLGESLDDWEPASSKLGSITTWGPKDIFVLDSLTFAGKAALRFILHLNGRSAQQPYQSDWMEGQALLEGLLNRLYSASVKCNVIVISHVTLIGKEKEKDEKTGQWHDIDQRGYATSLGRALSPTIGRYFNSVLYAESKTFGDTTRREIKTVPVRNIELKNSNPLKVKPTYKLETGLARFFADVMSSPDGGPEASPSV